MGKVFMKIVDSSYMKNTVYHLLSSVVSFMQFKVVQRTHYSICWNRTLSFGLVISLSFFALNCMIYDLFLWIYIRNTLKLIWRQQKIAKVFPGIYNNLLLLYKNQLNCYMHNEKKERKRGVPLLMQPTKFHLDFHSELKATR